MVSAQVHFLTSIGRCKGTEYAKLLTVYNGSYGKPLLAMREKLRKAYTDISHATTFKQVIGMGCVVAG